MKHLSANRFFLLLTFFCNGLNMSHNRSNPMKRMSGVVITNAEDEKIEEAQAKTQLDFIFVFCNFANHMVPIASKIFLDR